MGVVKRLGRFRGQPDFDGLRAGQFAAGHGQPARLLGADVIGRTLAGTGELQAGLITAAIGGPLFVALARRRKLAAL